MKLLYATDLHGVTWKYNKILRIAEDSNVDAVILGGDMLPKEGNLFNQGKYIMNYLDGYFAKFDDAGIYCLCCLGNDDLMIFDDLFTDTCLKYSNVVNIAGRKKKIFNYEFIGMNLIVDNPFRLKDRCRIDTENYLFQLQIGAGLLSSPDGFREVTDWPHYARELPTIEDELANLVLPVDISQTVYVFHMPPINLGLDRCFLGKDFGSEAIYRFILERQPLLSLHGHIHESPELSGNWYAKLGHTCCIQPGQLEDLIYVIIDLDIMKIERFCK